MDRCVFCGRLIENGTEVVSLRKSSYDQGTLSTPRELGMVHATPCFEREFVSPKTVLDNLKKMAKAAAKKARR
jgi:hypothetical protein